MPFFQQSSKFLKEFDLFGTPISLNLDKKSRYKSILGALVSLASMFLICTLCWNNYINQENLQINTENDFNPNPDVLTLNQENFFFAIGLQQLYPIAFSEIPYFSILVEQAYYEGTQDVKQKTFKTISMERCKQEHIEHLNSLTQDSIQRIGLNNLICPSILLQGQYTSQIFQFLKIRVIDCNDQQKQWDFDRCGTQNERDNFLKLQNQFRINIYHTNYSINLNNKESYYYEYLNEELSFTFVPGRVYKQNDIFFKPVNIKSDENSLVTQSIVEKGFILQEYRDMREYFTLDTFGSLDHQISYLRRSPDSINMRREYQKFSAVMVQFGGLIKFIITLAGFFVTEYNSFLFTIELANKLYNFNFGPQKQNKSQSEIMESKKESLTKIRSNEVSPLKINPNIQMTVLNKEQNKTKMQYLNVNTKDILGTLKRNSKNDQLPPSLTPSISKLEEKLKQGIQELDNNINNTNTNNKSNNRKGSLDQIEELQYNPLNKASMTFEQPNKESKEAIPSFTEDPMKQRIAQKFQNMRKDSVRQLQIFQENIQNQYYNNIKKKKQSIQISRIQQQNDKKASQSTNNLYKDDIKGVLTNEVIPEKKLKPHLPLFQSSNIIQNLVNFREIGFKNKKDFLLEQFRTIINRSKKIKVKVWYFLRLFTCGKCFSTEENVLIEKARSYAQKDLDIYIILEKLQEIEKIKKILFDENQQTLFNFSQKPLIQKNDHIYNTLSLRNLQIKHRKSETFSSKAKLNASANNILNQQQTLFCQKLQYDNIEAYEVFLYCIQYIIYLFQKDNQKDLIKYLNSCQLNIINKKKEQKNTLLEQIKFFYYKNQLKKQKLHKAYENIQPFHIQDKVSRQLVKEIGPELREIFELSKIIEGQTDNTPKSTPQQKQRSKVFDCQQKSIDELDLNQIKKKSICGRKSINICDHQIKEQKVPSKLFQDGECQSHEDSSVDESPYPNHDQVIANPHTFTISTSNKPARLSIFKNLKGVVIQDQGMNQIESDSNDSDKSDSSASSQDKQNNNKYNQNGKQQIYQNIIKTIGNIQEEFLDSNISQSQNLRIEDQQCLQDNQSLKTDNQDIKIQENGYYFQNDQPNIVLKQPDFDMSLSFKKMNLALISLNQTLFLQDIDMDLMNDSSQKTIAEFHFQDQNIAQKETQHQPNKPFYD